MARSAEDGKENVDMVRIPGKTEVTQEFYQKQICQSEILAAAQIDFGKQEQKINLLKGYWEAL